MEVMKTSKLTLESQWQFLAVSFTALNGLDWVEEFSAVMQKCWLSCGFLRNELEMGFIEEVDGIFEVEEVTWIEI